MIVQRRKPAIALVCAVVLMGAWMGSSAVAGAGEVMAGVAVAGVPVSGLESGELLTRLGPAARAFDRRPMTLQVGERTWTRTPESMGITVDLNRSALNALSAGRTSSFSWMLQSLASKDHKLAWVAKVDEAGLKAAIEELTAQVKVEASNGDFKVAGSQVTIIPPEEGVGLVESSARALLLRAAVSPMPGDRVSLPVRKTAPQITLEQLQLVEQQAEAILKAPVDFLFNGRTFSVAAEKIAPALKVSEVKAGNDQALVLSADPTVLKNQIVAAAPFVQTEPKDASFSVSGSKVILQPSVEGSTVDTTRAAAALVDLADGERGPIQLPSTTTAPAFTSDAASKLGINQRVAGFTTAFNASNVPRVGNIDRMADAIDGKVLKPGEVFSLNGATGARTVANGYQEAGILVDGELVPGIGGGVCQVATTLFNAVFSAGLDVGERSNHSLWVSSYPTGKDAMVNFGTQDLTFSNDTQFGILLKARVSAKDLTVSIYSSPLGRTVTESTSPQTNPRVPPVKYIEDPLMFKGQETLMEPGIGGFDVTVNRTVTQGGKVLHSDKFVSKYKPWKRIIKRGTGSEAPAGTVLTPIPAIDAPAPAEVTPPPAAADSSPPDQDPAAPGDLSPPPDPLAPTDLPPPPISTDS